MDVNMGGTEFARRGDTAQRTKRLHAALGAGPSSSRASTATGRVRCCAWALGLWRGLGIGRRPMLRQHGVREKAALDGLVHILGWRFAALLAFLDVVVGLRWKRVGDSSSAAGTGLFFIFQPSAAAASLRIRTFWNTRSQGWSHKLSPLS